MTPFYLQSLVTKMAKSQRNTEPQPLILILTIYVVIIKEKKINLKGFWLPEAESKTFLQKRAVLEINFKKHLLKQHFLAELSMNHMVLKFK